MKETLEDLYQIISNAISNAILEAWDEAWADIFLDEDYFEVVFSYYPSGSREVRPYSLSNDEIDVIEELIHTLRNAGQPEWKKGRFWISNTGDFKFTFEY